jgi:hypothetical protein
VSPAPFKTYPPYNSEEDAIDYSAEEEEGEEEELQIILEKDPEFDEQGNAISECTVIQLIQYISYIYRNSHTILSHVISALPCDFQTFSHYHKHSSLVI